MRKIAFSSGVILSILIACYLYVFSIESSSTISVSSSDGLKLAFIPDSGLISSMISPAGHIESPDSIAESGFFVRDLKSGKKLVHLLGTMKSDGQELVYNALNDKLGLQVKATFSGEGKKIDMDIDITDLTNADRILTLYFALPVDTKGWSWGDDMRNSRVIKGSSEMSNTVNIGFGVDGKMSRYPFAAVSGTDGIALGYPIDHPAVIRLAANPVSKHLYIAYDLALSRKAKTPCQANLKAVIFRFPPEWGFRAALKKYYEIYPEYFQKRVKKEGIWVFRPRYLNRIPDVDDFGFAFHTVDFNPWSLKFEDKHDIYSLNYLTEPWTHYMEMPSTLRDGKYDNVIKYVQHEAKKGNKKAVAALNSGVFDDTNKFVFWVNRPAARWCPDCAIFTLNSDPDIKDNEYPLNKAHFEWYDNNSLIYSTDTSSGILDGEFIDSFEARASVLDYRENHIAAADLPLAYDSKLLRPAVPTVFATYEFSKWVEDKVHGMGKLLMANHVLQKFAFPAHLFDVMAVESGRKTILPENDRLMNFWRSMSYQKPYCLLYHDDFKGFTHDFVEKYFQISLFYGLYPGIVANNGLSVIYFKKPELYERDRDLFKKYIPLIRALGKAGWEPVTYIRSSEAGVYVERYGQGKSLYITARNVNELPLDYELQIEAEKLGLFSVRDAMFKDLISGITFKATVNGSHIKIQDTLESGGVRIFYLYRV